MKEFIRFYFTDNTFRDIERYQDGRDLYLDIKEKTIKQPGNGHWFGFVNLNTVKFYELRDEKTIIDTTKVQEIRKRN